MQAEQYNYVDREFLCEFGCGKKYSYRLVSAAVLNTEGPSTTPIEARALNRQVRKNLLKHYRSNQHKVQYHEKKKRQKKEKAAARASFNKYGHAEFEHDPSCFLHQEVLHGRIEQRKTKHADDPPSVQINGNVHMQSLMHSRYEYWRQNLSSLLHSLVATLGIQDQWVLDNCSELASNKRDSKDQLEHADTLLIPGQGYRGKLSCIIITNGVEEKVASTAFSNVTCNEWPGEDAFSPKHWDMWNHDRYSSHLVSGGSIRIFWQHMPHYGPLNSTVDCRYAVFCTLCPPAHHSVSACVTEDQINAFSWSLAVEWPETWQWHLRHLLVICSAVKGGALDHIEGSMKDFEGLSKYLLKTKVLVAQTIEELLVEIGKKSLKSKNSNKRRRI